jgi:hypothetical protein
MPDNKIFFKPDPSENNESRFRNSCLLATILAIPAAIIREELAGEQSGALHR